MTESPPALQLHPGMHVHFIGIGGAGMSALAQILLLREITVSGSDLRGGPSCMALEAMGATVYIGHVAEQVGGADLVVVSNAVPQGNVERLRAQELGIPVILRADLLELLLQGWRRILVSGTHGKTTTTSMTTVALQACGLDPSFAIGGALHESGTSAHHGTGSVFVAEADEAFRSFLRMTPDLAVVTNVEMDHHDVYDSLEAVTEAFAEFLARRPEGGTALLCADDPGAAGLASGATPPVRTYGTVEGADVRAVDIVAHPGGGSSFRVIEDGQPLGDFAIRLPGRHNVLNATAAIAAARWAGGEPAAIAEGLESFAGAMRRFQRLGTVAGVTVVDDYAIHPTEIAVTIAAAHQATPNGRVIAVFQPHRYSRTEALGAELGRSLAGADLVVVTDVYAASEAAVPGVTGVLVADAAADAGAEVRFLPSLADLPRVLGDLAQPGDTVLTMGAGDITQIGPQLLLRLEGRSERRQPAEDPTGPQARRLGRGDQASPA